ENEYFSDGLAEELINVLARLEGLHVAARTSAFRFRGKDLDIREIGKQLDVSTVLEGSVRKAGNKLRITAQLINVADGYHLWSDRYDRELEDIFVIQDEIAQAIVDQLKVKLGAKAGAPLVKRYTENLEAYNLYLKGHYHRSKLTVEGFEKGIQYFEEAIEIDPSYALAHAGLSMLHVNQSFWGMVPPHKAYPKAREAAEKALEIDETVAEAHTAMGYIYTFYDWNWETAEREFKRALELEPHSALTHVSYSHFLTIQKRNEEAIFEAKHAQKLDPLSSLINGFAAIAFYHAGLYEEEIVGSQETIARDPNDFFSHLSLGMAYREKAMVEEAITELEKAIELSGATPMAVTELAIACYRFDRKDQADNLFHSLKERSQHEYVPPTFFVSIHLARGEVEEACQWLEKVYEEHDSFFLFLRLPPLQLPSDPRFDDILNNMGLKR
ncbi:MAG: hypothetical protein ACE5G1_06810, partial [bacterium]